MSSRAQPRDLRMDEIFRRISYRRDRACPCPQDYIVNPRMGAETHPYAYNQKTEYSSLGEEGGICNANDGGRDN